MGRKMVKTGRHALSVLPGQVNIGEAVDYFKKLCRKVRRPPLPRF